MSDWASTAHLPNTAVCDGCPHPLLMHDGEHQECRLCVCDGFVVSAEDAAAVETMLPAQDYGPPEPWDRVGILPTPESVARNRENGQRAQEAALVEIAGRQAQTRKKAG